MEKQNTIYQDLIKLQSELTTIQKNKTGYITKTAKFQYADLTAIWEHIRKPLTKNNFAIIQLIDSEEDKTYIVTKLIHASGEIIESKTFVPGRAVQPKESGILYTYYKRYALSSILGLTTDEDADQFLREQEHMFKEDMITATKAMELASLLEGHKDIDMAVKNHYKIKHLAELKACNYEQAKNTILKRIDLKNNQVKK